MARSFNSVLEYRIALEKAITDTMINEVAEHAKEALQESMEENVYSVYWPEFFNRRMEAGGLKDKANMTEDYYSSGDYRTLEISATAPWQSLGFKTIDGRGTYGGDLSDVIENDGMYGAPPRPFTKPAEERYEKRFDRDLQHGIIKRGL